MQQRMDYVALSPQQNPESPAAAGASPSRSPAQQHQQELPFQLQPSITDVLDHWLSETNDRLSEAEKRLRAERVWSTVSLWCEVFEASDDSPDESSTASDKLPPAACQTLLAALKPHHMKIKPLKLIISAMEKARPDAQTLYTLVNVGLREAWARSRGLPWPMLYDVMSRYRGEAISWQAMHEVVSRKDVVDYFLSVVREKGTLKLPFHELLQPDTAANMPFPNAAAFKALQRGCLDASHSPDKCPDAQAGGSRHS